MPIIDNVRLVNIIYSDGARRVPDLKMALRGHDTLTLLENGGGKSIITKYLMLPLLFHKNKIRDRKTGKVIYDISKYAQDNYKPFYIAIEWILDDGKGRFMTVVGGQQQPDKTIKKIAFTHSYYGENNYSINNFPFTKEAGPGLISIQPLEKIVEEIKALPTGKYELAYFRDDSRGKKDYASKLMENKIRIEEWERVVAKVNDSEGGLEKLFNDVNSTRDLIVKWILPTIMSTLEEHLEEKESRTKTSEDILLSFAERKEADLESFKDLEAYKGFIEDLSRIHLETSANEKYQYSYKEARCNLANTYYVVSNLEKKCKEEQEIAEQSINRIKDEIKDLEYQKLSQKIQNNLIKLEDFETKINAYKKRLEELDVQERQYNRELAIQECIEQLGHINERKQEIGQNEAELQKLSGDISEIKQQTADVHKTLQKLYKNEINDIETQKAEQERVKQDKTKTKLVLEKETKKLSDELARLSDDLAESNAKIDFLSSQVAVYSEQYDDSVSCVDADNKIINSMRMGAYNNALEQAYVSCADEITSADKNSEENKQLQEAARQEEGKLDKSARIIEEAQKEVASALKKLQEDEASILLEGNMFNLSRDELYEKEKTLLKLDKIQDELNKEVDMARKQEEDLREELDVFQNNHIPQTTKVAKIFIENGISFQYGLEWLQTYEVSEDKRNEFLKNNPLIPYALIVDEDGLKKAELIQHSHMTSSVLPILVRKNLSNSLLDQQGSMIKLSGVSLFVGKDSHITSEGYRLKKISELNEAIKSIKLFVNECNKKISRCVILKNKIKEYPYSLNEEALLISQLDELAQKLELNRKERDLNQLSLSRLKEEYEQNRLKLQELHRQESHLTTKKTLFRTIYEVYLRDEQVYIKQIKLKEDKNECQRLQVETAENLRNVKEQIENIDKVIKAYVEKIRDIEIKQVVYLNYDGNGVVLEDKDIPTLKGILESFKNSSVLKTEEDLIRKNKELGRDIFERQKRIESYGIDLAEYQYRTYDFVAVKDARAKISGISDERNKINRDLGADGFNRDNVKNVIIEDEKVCLDTYLKPYSQEELKGINFKQEIQNAKAKKTNLDVLSGDLKEKLQELRSALRFQLHKYSQGIDITETPIEEDATGDNYPEYIERYTKQETEADAASRDARKRIAGLWDVTENKFKSVEKLARLISAMRKREGLESQSILDRIASLKTEVQRLESTTEAINSELDAIIGTIISNVSLVHTHVRKMHRASWVNNKRYFEMKVPEKIDTQRVKDHIYSLIDLCMGQDKEKKKEIIRNGIEMDVLLDEAINLSTIKAYVLKTDHFSCRPIPFEDGLKESKTSNVSGAQSVVISMIVVQMILKYSSDQFIGNDDDSFPVFSRENSPSVLLLDNPFSNIHSEQYIEELLSIAKEFNTQLFCWTDIKLPAVIRQFKNFYMANLYQSGDYQYLEFKQKLADDAELVLGNNIRETVGTASGERKINVEQTKFNL